VEGDSGPPPRSLCFAGFFRERAMCVVVGWGRTSRRGIDSGLLAPTVPAVRLGRLRVRAKG